MSEMESVRDYNSIDLSALALKTRGPAYNGVETFDVEYEENGPLYVANAVPLKIVKGVRTDIEGREFIILSQKNLPEEMTKALNGVVERLAALCWKGYTQSSRPTVVPLDWLTILRCSTPAGRLSRTTRAGPAIIE